MLIILLKSLRVVCVFFIGYFLGRIKGYPEATGVAIKELDKLLYKEVGERWLYNEKNTL